MAGLTPYYKMAFFDFGDSLQSPINVKLEIDRFVFLDKQLYGLYSIFGDGVITGWEIYDSGYSSSAGITLGVSPGVGIIRNLACETVFPSSIKAVPSAATSYIYAILRGSTSTNRLVDFVVSASSINIQGALLLATVATSSNGVISIDSTVRTYASFRQAAQDAVDSHKHRGTPSKINLSLETKGQLPSAKIEGIDSSQIISGKVDATRIPVIDHSDLKNNGILTHAQLDTAVQALSGSTSPLMGEMALTNFLRQVIFLKSVYPTIDSNFINELAFIPGTTDNYFDSENTTALIDSTGGKIAGLPAGESCSYLFSTNFELTSPPKAVFITSSKALPNGSTLTFGVNSTNSVSWADYTELEEDTVEPVTGIGNNLRIGAKFVGPSLTPNEESDYDEVMTEYATFMVNNLRFSYTTASPVEVDCHFKVTLYSDPEKMNTVLVDSSELHPERFSVNNTAFPVGGIPNTETINILYDPAGSGISCETTYYLDIEVKEDSGAYSLLSDAYTFLTKCNPTFRCYSDFTFINEDTVEKDFHFRIRFFSDAARTTLVHSAFSFDDQDRWLIDDEDAIPSGGYSIAADGTVNVTYFPDTQHFNPDQVYYVVIDAFDGSVFESEISNYTFIIDEDSNGCADDSSLPVLYNFAVMFELENGDKLTLNL